jgi:hypothetical protein
MFLITAAALPPVEKKAGLHFLVHGFSARYYSDASAVVIATLYLYK